MAIVQGSRFEPYTCELFIHSPREVESICSCPYDHYCKHGFASLLALVDHFDGRPNPRVPVAEISGSLSEFLDEVDSSELLHEVETSGTVTSPATLMREQWLDTFIKTQSGDVHTAEPIQDPRFQMTQWLYRIVHEPDNGSTSLSILSAKTLKSGALSKGKLFRVGYDHTFHYDIDESDIDREIHALCEAQLRTESISRYEPHQGVHVLRGRLGGLLLDLIIQSGRAFIDNDRTTPLRSGPTRTLTADWMETFDSQDNPVHLLEVELGGNEVAWQVITDPPRYIEPDSGICGLIDGSYSPRTIDLLRTIPPIPADEAKSFATRLAMSLDDPGIPLPVDVDIGIEESEPKGFLLIHAIDNQPHVDHWALAALAAYGPCTIGLDPLAIDTRDQHLELCHRDDGDPVRIRRRPAREFELYEQFRKRFPDFEAVGLSTQARFAFADHRPVSASAASTFDAFKAIVDAREALAEEGWHLQVRKPVNTTATTLRQIDADLAPAETGWFDLALGVIHDGKRHDLLPMVVDWLGQDDQDAALLTQAEDGSWLQIPAAVLRPIAATLAELGNDDNTRIKLSRARSLALEPLSRELEEAEISTNWTGAEKLFGLADQLESLATIDIDASVGETILQPPALTASMRPYQLTGLAWLDTLADSQLNGILADDMGLGKTLQTLAHILASRSCGRLTGPTLVVAPTSLLGNWAREAATFTPTLTVRIWHGIERHAEPLDQDESAIVITSYALALRDHELLAEHGFEFLVLDEAQMIKNPVAKISQSLRRLPIERRLCLTGTPLENHLGELWSLFDFLAPGLLGNRARFTRHFRTPIEKHGDTDRQHRLANAIRPFVLRRRKEEVATELPKKTEIIREVTLGAAQSALYETIRVAMQQRVQELLKTRGFRKSRIEMLDALLKLRQTCCHPDLVKLPSARKVKESAKTITALDMIEELVAEGRKLLVFSQFTEMLSILEHELDERGVRYVKLTGRTRKRDTVIDAFQHGDVPVFLISLKAGGTGLNLTAADTVIHYDPWWNPAVERQASDRAHRIGQDKPVFVYKLVAQGTVEERIVGMQATKQQLADATLERKADEAGSAFSAEEMLALFDE